MKHTDVFPAVTDGGSRRSSVGDRGRRNRSERGRHNSYGVGRTKVFAARAVDKDNNGGGAVEDEGWHEVLG